jgi:5-formyltetrahydrofolate cyclo-ligase
MKPEKLPGIAGVKAALRQQMRTRLERQSKDDRARASLEICRRAAELPAFRQAQAVAVFAPLPNEPDIHPLIEEAWAEKKRVAFPLMSHNGGVPRLDWLVAEDWDALVVVGPLGLREPSPKICPRIDPLELDCIFVPGLAFDPRGHRLGRGGGYYDAALAALDIGTPRIGLFFACQQADEVPRETHDQILTAITTEDGVMVVK